MLTKCWSIFRFPIAVLLITCFITIKLLFITTMVTIYLLLAPPSGLFWYCNKESNIPKYLCSFWVKDWTSIMQTFSFIILVEKSIIMTSTTDALSLVTGLRIVYLWVFATNLCFLTVVTPLTVSLCVMLSVVINSIVTIVFNVGATEQRVSV